MKPVKLLPSHSTTPVPQSPEAQARAIRDAFVRGDASRSALFERVKTEAEAKIAAAAYLRVLGVLE